MLISGPWCDYSANFMVSTIATTWAWQCWRILSCRSARAPRARRTTEKLKEKDHYSASQWTTLLSHQSQRAWIH